MTTIDVSALSKDELLKLRKDLDKAIENYDRRQRKEALAAAEAKAREMGFSLAELTGGSAGAEKGTVNPPKYQHPENPELTWTGRGRQPAWIKERLAEGKSLDAFLIAK
ncbi:hypothetical protein OCH239_05270 [Roseivivax halodurans JCM 10272]|uniref:DNA-binding protein H-NS-like C-terminal domain-containing protein n=2 Tax=Roseivivax halodurans TaxID=93683 RepID=X7EFP5_9RHOB|nr:H-NS histone family protein [Roseivivax halodurans]ETX14051.1 hypothetical protein OCH239_05270 [Roseivivax halodurans JCM 10272]